MTEPSYEDFLEGTSAAWQFFRESIQKVKDNLVINEGFLQSAAELIMPDHVEKHRQDIRSMGFDPDEPPFYTAFLQDKNDYENQLECVKKLRSEVQFLEWYGKASPDDICSCPVEEYPSVYVPLLFIRLVDFNDEQIGIEYDKWNDHYHHCREKGVWFNMGEHAAWRMREAIRDIRSDIFKPILAIEETANIIEQEQTRNPAITEQEVADMWQRSKESLDKQWNIDMPIPSHYQQPVKKKRPWAFMRRLFR